MTMGKRSICDKLRYMSDEALRKYRDEAAMERDYWLERAEALRDARRKYLELLNKKLNRCDLELESLGGILDMMDDFAEAGDYDVLEGEYGVYDRTAGRFYKFLEVHSKYEYYRDKKREFQLKIYEYNKEMDEKISACEESATACFKKLATICEFLYDETPGEAGLQSSEVPF